MNVATNCAIADRGELARRYATNRMNDQEQEAYELHLLRCETCVDELRFAHAAVSVLETTAIAPKRRWRTGVYVAAGLGLAAALLLFARPRAPSGDIGHLGSVAAPPAYLGIPVRGASDADSSFELGMRHYNEEQWDAAAAELRKAATSGAPADVTWFFIGAAELMSSQPASADSAFSTVIAQGEGPYLAEARLYRAKTLIQRGMPREAMAELRQVSPDASVGAHARALRDSMHGAGVR
jgi:hypothetical protein